jgi:hypothetical protein
MVVAGTVRRRASDQKATSTPKVPTPFDDIDGQTPGAAIRAGALLMWIRS